MSGLAFRRIPTDPNDSTSPGSLEALNAMLPHVKGLAFNDGSTRHGQSVEAYIKTKIEFVRTGREIAARQPAAEPAPTAIGAQRFLQ